MTTPDTPNTPSPLPEATLPACPWCEDAPPCSCLTERMATFRNAEVVVEFEHSLKAALERAKADTAEQVAAAAAEAVAKTKGAEEAAAAAKAAAAEQIAQAEALAGEKAARPGLGERINTWWGDRHQRKLTRLQASAAAAAALREYQTAPAVVALEAERRWRLVKRVLWGAILGGLAFTMVNVHHFVITADKVEKFAPQWFAAWLLDPMVSLLFVALILAEEITEQWEVPIKGVWPALAKWGGFTATYVMNTWSAWIDVVSRGLSMDTVDRVMLHSVPPIVVLVAVETLPIIRRKMSKAIAAAATVAETGRLPEPERKPRRPRRDRSKAKAAPASVPQQAQIPAPDKLVDTNEFKKIEQGEWPNLADAPVSPAGSTPTAHHSESQLTDESEVRTPEPTHPEPHTDERPTYEPALSEEAPPKVTYSGGDVPSGPLDPTNLPPFTKRSAKWQELPLRDRCAQVWSECNQRPSGQQLADATGGSKSQCNAWKREHHPELANSPNG